MLIFIFYFEFWDSGILGFWDSGILGFQNLPSNSRIFLSIQQVIPFPLCFAPHPFRLLQRSYLPWIPAFAGMTFSATSMAKAVIPARSLPSTTIGGWNPGKVRERKGSKGTVGLFCGVNIK
jgi:hypothetical protein